MTPAMSNLAGRYELERRLGGGGMAEVFLARLVGKDGFSRRVAIKRVLAHLATEESFAKMFVAEAQICAALQHPNIVSVLDFDRDEAGRPFLVIELVDGPSLAELADGGALPVAAALHLATDVLRGLAYAHDHSTSEGVRGVVHRDISPHNVLLSWEGAVKVSDFGIAKARAASGVTASELLKGKPAYMSPEQANGEVLDGRSDLFAVGIVLWELLVGRALFAGHTTQEVLARVLFAPIPSPRSLRPEIAADVDAVVMTLLARERDQRYASADAAIAALLACADYPRDGRERLVAVLAERFAATAPQRSRMLADVSTVRTPLEGAPTLPSPRDADPRRRRRIVRAAIALAVVAVAALVIGIRSLLTPETTSLAPSEGANTIASVLAAIQRDTELVHREAGFAIERAKVMAEIRKTGRGVLPFPPLDAETSVDPIAYYERARVEVRRLFGERGELIQLSMTIGPNGRVDATIPGEGMSAYFTIQPPTTDGFHCVEFSSYAKDVPRFKMMLVRTSDACQGRDFRSGIPHCTGSELYRRARTLGYQEHGRVYARLESDRWYLSVGDFETSTPNDCH